MLCGVRKIFIEIFQRESEEKKLSANDFFRFLYVKQNREIIQQNHFQPIAVAPLSHIRRILIDKVTYVDVKEVKRERIEID